MASSNTLIIAGAGVALLYFAMSSSAAPSSVGTLDITSCPTNVNVQPGKSVEIPISVRAVNGNVSKTLKIVAGSYTDSKPVTLNKDQTDVITFTVPNVTTSISYVVSVI